MNHSGYYSRKLAAERLKLCYELAPARVQRYLSAEIEFIRGHTAPGSRVLELGCGYGRVLQALLTAKADLYGVDTSAESLGTARDEMKGTGVALFRMDAAALAFRKGSFDLVFCIQNGISAFGIDPLELASEAVRATRSGGRVLFSSYTDSFWEDRLDWFRIQSAHGLIGDIDHSRTGDGVIVCRDGFRAVTYRPEDFRKLAETLGRPSTLTEVDGSSLFLEIAVD